MIRSVPTSSISAKNADVKLKTAERVMNIFAQIGTYRPFESGHCGRHDVQSRQHDRKGLSHVTNDELQSGEAVEYTAENNAQHVGRRFDMPPPSRPGERKRDHL